MGGGASSSAQAESATYYAKVPQNARPGDVIPADINGRTVHVKVPPGTAAGQLFRYSMSDCVPAPIGPPFGQPAVPPPSSFSQPPTFGQPPSFGQSTGVTPTGPAVSPITPTNVSSLSNSYTPQTVSSQLGPSSSVRQQAPTTVQMPQQIHAPPSGYTANIPLQQMQQPGMPQQYIIYQQPPQQHQGSTAHLSGAQIVQQFGYHQQPIPASNQPGAAMVHQIQMQSMQQVNTPFPTQHYQQQPHFIMTSQHQQHQQQHQHYMPTQQYIIMQPQQFGTNPQQQYQYGQSQSQYAAQTHIPVATPI